MLVREDSIPKVNVYSSKILFEQVDNRNKKRMAQMLKRKSALSAKNKDVKEKENNISPMKSPLVSKINKEDDLLIINLESKKDSNSNMDNSGFEKDFLFELKLESDNTNKYKKHLICESNIVDNSPLRSNKTFFNENNNYYNNSSTNNSNNNSIINRDSQEKEVNISNLENDSLDDIIINKEDNNLEEDCLNLNNDNEKVLSKSLYNYDHDDETNLSKEERKIKEENEYALKYLTSSSDSFVQLDNNLVAKAKAQGGEITESYFQALFPDLMNDTNKSLKSKNYEVTEIIKEEKETDSPFGKTYCDSKISKTNRVSLNKKGDSKNNILIKNKKKKKKSLVKTKSNTLLINNRSIKYLDKSKRNKENKALLGKKYKSISNFNNIKESINNNVKKNKIIKKDKIKKEKLNLSSSYTNLNTNKIRKNKIDLKISNDHFFYSTFSSNLYKKRKNEDKSNINNSFKLIDGENDTNDTFLINNCVKNIEKTKNIKISKHYLKNINFYNNCTETNNKNKLIKMRNISNNNIDNLKSTILTNKSKISSLKTKDISTKSKNILIKNEPKKNLKNDKIKYIKKNITNRNILHKNCISFFSFNDSINPKKHLTIKDRGKSFSKLILKKTENNNMLNTEPNFTRNKSNHRKLNTMSNYENINTETSITKTRINKNNNISNNTLVNKKKFVQHYKKVDYSYVKAKVETGLSEEVLKKLLNNNKKLANKEANKKNEKQNKQSLLKRCKIGINKTISNFKVMASNIKQKLFKKEKNEKFNINNNDNININRNFKNKK